ncbi:MAG: hypothetical protein AAB740_02560 [Patescibacteria group bacterium]
MEFFRQNRKIILIALGAIVIISLIYFFWPSTATPPPTGQINLPSYVGPAEVVPSGEEAEFEATQKVYEEGIKTSLEDRLVQITNFPTISPSLDKNESKIIYYKKDGGDMMSSDLNGKNQEKISHITIIGLLNAIWSPVRDRAAVFYLDQDILKSFIQVGTSSISVLPQDIKDFSWAPDGRSALYTLRRGSLLDFSVSDSSGRNPKVIYSTPLYDSLASFITSDKIALQSAPSGLVEGSLFTFSRSNSLLSKVKSGVLGMTSLWSPDGSHFVMSRFDPTSRSSMLSVYNSAGGEVFITELAGTTYKCVWASNQEVACAIPRIVSFGNIWPDDYLKGGFRTKDQVVQINVVKKEIYGVFSEPVFDMSDLIITKNQEYLFWINRSDGTLWSLKLK